jgi:type IV secretory pathway VirB10-like protein
MTPEPGQAPTPNEGPATVPTQPEVNAPIRKKYPLIIGLAGIVLLFGIANGISLLTGGKKAQAPRSSMPLKPSTANPQQVTSFETQQQMEAQRDQQQRARRQQVADQMRQLQAEEQAVAPGPESDAAAPMTRAQRQAIYGDNNPNAPKRVSGMSEAQAEVKQRRLAREKQQQDAINSDTVAIDFAHGSSAPTASNSTPAASTTGDPNTDRTLAELDQQEQQLRQMAAQNQGVESEATSSPIAPTGSSAVHVEPVSMQRPRPEPETKDAAISRYDFDAYDGKLYRVFEGTVFEGVVTNHIDGAFNGPILVMLTTDYYSHDHQELLLPQGTRLVGQIQAVNSGQQRKLMAIFHRAICPDGFSVDLDKFVGLDPVGTTGLASKVNNHYLSTFAAAAAIGGIGGLAQIGNGGIGVLGGDPGVMIRNGISEQTGQEAEQILNHFLNRLPVITLKEGSRAKVYISRDILIPSYADHRVVPNL